MTIWGTDLAPWEFEFPFPDSLTSTFQVQENMAGRYERLTVDELCAVSLAGVPPNPESIYFYLSIYIYIYICIYRYTYIILYLNIDIYTHIYTYIYM